MKIWFIEIGEPLPMEQGKRLLRYGYFTAFLSAHGHKVTWFTCDFSHAVKAHVVPPGEQTLDNGVRMVVLPGKGYPKNVSLMRVCHNRDYAKELDAALAKETDLPDLIFCPIPTVENAGVIQAFAQKHNIPYIIDVRDHWPRDLADRAPLLVRPFARLFLTPMLQMAKRAARDAAAITGVTRMQRDYGLSLAGRKADPARDQVFYLGYTRQPVPAATRNEAIAWWRGQGLKDGVKIASFTGTLGSSFDFAPIIAAARRLKDSGRHDIQFVIAGDGDSRAKLIAKAGNLAGDIMIFPGWIDQPKIEALLSHSAMALAPYIPNTSMSLPNKFFEYMAYGLPVLSSCTGESEDLIRQYNTGIQYNPQDHDAFYNAVLRVTDHPAEARAMGAAALTLFEQKFDQSMLFAHMERHLSTLAKAA